MAYKPAYIWNGTSFDQIGNQAVASLNDYAMLAPASTQTITNTSLTSPTITGTATVSANMSVTGRLDTADIREAVNSGTITTNVLTADYTLGTIWFIGTAPSANFTANITNVPTDNDKGITVVVMVTQGATGYIPNALQIDGASQTIKWLGGTTPTPTSSAGKIDVFNFTLIRRSSAWIVLANSSLNY